MYDLEWQDFLEIGVDFIDRDHKKILEIMLDTKVAIEDGNHKECVLLLTAMLKEAKDHFSREEEYLAKVKYPDLEKHKIYHKELLDKAELTKEICEGIKTEHDLNDCFKRLANFLIDDVLRGDIKFKSYLEYEGYLDKKLET